MHSTVSCSAAAAATFSAANARLYAMGQNTAIGNFLWQIGRRKVAIWAKESGKSGTCSLTEETNMKYESERNTVEKCRKWKWQIGRRKVANWAKGEEQLHSRTQSTYARFVNEKERVHVLAIPIMCTILHFQWNFLPQSVMEVQFPGYRHFVLPTHNTVSWGTWLGLRLFVIFRDSRGGLHFGLPPFGPIVLVQMTH